MTNMSNLRRVTMAAGESAMAEESTSASLLSRTMRRTLQMTDRDVTPSITHLSRPTLLMIGFIVSAILVFYLILTFKCWRAWVCNKFFGREFESPLGRGRPWLEDDQGDNETVLVHEGLVINLTNEQRRAVLEAIFSEASKAATDEDCPKRRKKRSIRGSKSKGIIPFDVAIPAINTDDTAEATDNGANDRSSTEAGDDATHFYSVFSVLDLDEEMVVNDEASAGSAPVASGSGFADVPPLLDVAERGQLQVVPEELVDINTVPTNRLDFEPSSEEEISTERRWFGRKRVMFVGARGLAAEPYVLSPPADHSDEEVTVAEEDILERGDASFSGLSNHSIPDVDSGENSPNEPTLADVALEPRLEAISSNCSYYFDAEEENTFNGTDDDEEEAGQEEEEHEVVSTRSVERRDSSGMTSMHGTIGDDATSSTPTFQPDQLARALSVHRNSGILSDFIIPEDEIAEEESRDHTPFDASLDGESVSNPDLAAPVPMKRHESFQTMASEYTYGDDDSTIGDNACPICLCSYRTGEMLVNSRYCQHVFHKECILDWLQKSESCPICRIGMVTNSEIKRTATALVEEDLPAFRNGVERVNPSSLSQQANRLSSHSWLAPGARARRIR